MNKQLILVMLGAGVLVPQRSPAQPTEAEPVAAAPTAAAEPAAAAAPQAAAEEAEAKPATFDAKDAQLCAAVDKREPVDVKTNFNTGEKAYFWMKLRANATNTESPRMKIRWSLNGDPYWTTDEMPVRWGRYWFYKTVDEPGEWTAEVLDENETVVTTSSFTATGESYKRPPAEDQAAEAPAADAAAGQPATP